MFGWKILATAVITIAVIIMALGSTLLGSLGAEDLNNTSGYIGTFFEKAKDTIGGIFTSIDNQKNILRNISFSLNASSYPSVNRNVKNANITIDSDLIKLNTSSSYFEFHKPTSIISFSGNVKIHDQTLMLNGNYEIIELADVKISGKDVIKKSSIKFNSITINPLSKDKLSLSNITGKLKISDLKLNLENKKIEIFNPFGKFSFSSRFIVKGIANKVIVTGNEKISITS